LCQRYRERESFLKPVACAKTLLVAWILVLKGPDADYKSTGSHELGK
jgi:hypothetical protein